MWLVASRFELKGLANTDFFLSNFCNSFEYFLKHEKRLLSGQNTFFCMISILSFLENHSYQRRTKIPKNYFNFAVNI